MLNTAENRPQAELNNIIDKFQDKLKTSGYSTDQQREIIVGGLIGYKRRLARQEGIRHRNSIRTLKRREREKSERRS